MWVLFDAYDCGDCRKAAAAPRAEGGGLRVKLSPDAVPD